MVRGYVNTEEFDKADYLQKEEANDDLINIRKSMRGRLDLIVIDKFVCLYLIQQEMPERQEKLNYLSHHSKKKPYMCS